MTQETQDHRVLQLAIDLTTLAQQPFAPETESFQRVQRACVARIDVGLKSPHCEHHMFADWAKAMLNVDAPGSTSANLPYLGHTRCRRPIFPLDQGVSLGAEVRVYRRW